MGKETTDCSYDYGYSRKVIFSITILSDVTNESNRLSQYRSHSWIPQPIEYNMGNVRILHRSQQLGMNSISHPRSK